MKKVQVRSKRHCNLGIGGSRIGKGTETMVVFARN